MAISSQVDHLWQVKETEYSNIIDILQEFQPSRWYRYLLIDMISDIKDFSLE